MALNDKGIASPVDMDEARWKRSVRKTAHRIRRAEDIQVALNVRMIERGGMVGMSIGATLVPKDEGTHGKPTKAPSRIQKRT